MYKILRKHHKDTAEFRGGNTAGNHFLDRVWRVGGTLGGGGSGEESPAQQERPRHGVSAPACARAEAGPSDGGRGRCKVTQVTPTENLHGHSSTQRLTGQWPMLRRELKTDAGAKKYQFPNRCQ